MAAKNQKQKLGPEQPYQVATGYSSVETLAALPRGSVIQVRFSLLRIWGCMQFVHVCGFPLPDLTLMSSWKIGPGELAGHSPVFLVILGGSFSNDLDRVVPIILSTFSSEGHGLNFAHELTKDNHIQFLGLKLHFTHAHICRSYILKEH